MLKFAIIGFGGLGKGHYRNIDEVRKIVEDIQLVAVCDEVIGAFREKTETNLDAGEEAEGISNYNLYTDVEELFEKEELDFVITALPTHIHEQIAVMAMKRGIHVFSEKPIALNVEQASNMIKTAKENNVKLMIGQCLRFSPLYATIRDIIMSKKYGKLIRAEFCRLSTTPKWSRNNWMLDESKSGGAALDLHVHDIDFVNWVFGKPNSVTSFATNYETKHDSITSVLQYDDLDIHITGDWSYTGNFPFTTGFKLKFENASIVQDNNDIIIYPREGEVFKQ